MTVNEIIALCNAGYNHEQIMQLAQAQQMERAAQMQPAQMQLAQAQQMQPAQAQQMHPAQVQPAQVQPAQADPYTAIMAELLGLKQAVQATNTMAAQQPAQPMTADDIIANIIAPKPRKEA